MSKQTNSAQQDQSSWLVRMLGLPTQGNYVVGMIKDAERARAASTALRRDSFAGEDVVILRPEEVEERVRGDGTNSTLSILAEESSYCEDYNERALGSTILSVYTHSGDDVARAYRILAAHGAYEIVYFGDWTIRKLLTADDA